MPVTAIFSNVICFIQPPPRGIPRTQARQSDWHYKDQSTSYDFQTFLPGKQLVTLILLPANACFQDQPKARKAYFGAYATHGPSALICLF